MNKMSAEHPSKQQQTIRYMHSHCFKILVHPDPPQPIPKVLQLYIYTYVCTSTSVYVLATVSLQGSI